MGNSVEILKGKKILLGVGAGISAYKSADLASKLASAGAEVFTVLTPNALNLIGAKTFEAITGKPVFCNMWEQRSEYNISHISLSEQADIIVVAPATADVIAKAALGICDDMLSTLVCAGWKKKALFAPAMNNNMWDNPSVAKNVGILKERGVIFAGPNEGRLACGTNAIGRMAEPAEILEEIIKVISKN